MSSLRCLRLGRVYRLTNSVKHFNIKITNAIAFHKTCLGFNDKVFEIKMPSLSPTMTEGTIVKWLKNQGDTISAGDVLCEIQTDKAIVGLEVEEEGILSKILVPENTKNIPLGEIIAVLVEEGGTVDMDKYSERKQPSSVSREKNGEVRDDIIKDSWRLCGPAVKKLLMDYNIKLDEVSGSGRQNIVLKGDILKHITDKNLKPTPLKKVTKSISDIKDKKVIPGKKFIDVEILPAEKNFVQKLITSKLTKPHAYMNVDCKIDKVVDCKKKLKQNGIDASIDDFIIKSVATVLKKMPIFNTFQQEGKLQQLKFVNIVFTTFKNKQYVSFVVKNADKLPLSALTNIDKVLVDDKQEFSCFRISNLGMFPISEFSSVLYHHETATLTIGTVQDVLDGQILIPKICATLSFNNAVISEVDAAEFLHLFQQFLEQPFSISC